MPKGAVIHTYLPTQMCRDAMEGKVNIINRIAASVAPLGCKLAFHADNPAELGKAVARGGLSIVHMTDPVTPTGLTLRRAYHYPFWQIEATASRGAFDVARAVFDLVEIDPILAQTFAHKLRSRVFGAVTTSQDGYVFMPLQGRLLQHRSFQTMSPITMIEETLRVEPHLPLRAALHPKESYEAEDLAALARIERRSDRFKLVQADAVTLLRGCNYVVTQNSAVALNGYLLDKQAVLFAQIDFHHIAGSVWQNGSDAAFARVKSGTPDFAAYLYWFFKIHTINAGAADAEDRILARLRRHGWFQ